MSRKQKDLELAIEIGDRCLHVLYHSGLKNLIFKFKVPPVKPVEIYDLRFPSPLTFAAFKEDILTLDLWFSLGIGGGCLKTVLSAPREGNKRPRIAEIQINNQSCLVNAMGLPGKGARCSIENLKRSNLMAYNRPIGFSIGGGGPDEYIQVLELIESETNKIHPIYYEINISCPNTQEGQNLLKNPDLFEKTLKKIRSKTDRVISVKLSPDQSDKEVLFFSEIISNLDKMMINVGNTQNIAYKTLSTGKGGLSGPALFKRTLEMTTLLSTLKTPIVSTGGICSKNDIFALKKSGSHLFGLATALVQNPYVIPRLNQLFIDL